LTSLAQVQPEAGAGSLLSPRELPGYRKQMDSPFANDLEVTIAGRPLPHLFCHAVLTYSNQEWVERCKTECLLSLNQGLSWAMERMPDGTRVDREHLLGFLLALQ